MHLQLKIMFEKSSKKSRGPFLAQRASSNVTSIWLDIGQFWGNLAKSLTDAGMNVDK